MRRLLTRMAGKVVVDIPNPLGQTFEALATAPGTSSAAGVATMTAGTSVVETFDTTFSGRLVEGRVAGQPLDVLIAGDDGAAKETVAQLAPDGDLRAIDVCPLERVRRVEGLGFLGITLQRPLGLGFRSARTLIRYVVLEHIEIGD